NMPPLAGMPAQMGPELANQVSTMFPKGAHAAPRQETREKIARLLPGLLAFEQVQHKKQALILAQDIFQALDPTQPQGQMMPGPGPGTMPVNPAAQPAPQQPDGQP